MLNSLRLVVDESLSIGVLGATGRGITEHFGLHVNDVDLLTGSLEAVLGSVGGFLVGTQLIVDHLVLSAAGYVFSASAPAYTATAASEALRLLDETHEGPERLKKLETNTKRARKELARVVKPAGKKPAYFDVLGDESSPLILLQLGKEYSVYRKTLKAASDAVDDGVEDGFQKLALKSKRENELEDSRREDLRVLRAIAVRRILISYGTEPIQFLMLAMSFVYLLPLCPHSLSLLYIFPQMFDCLFD